MNEKKTCSTKDLLGDNSPDTQDGKPTERSSCEKGTLVIRFRSLGRECGRGAIFQNNVIVV